MDSQSLTVFVANSHKQPKHRTQKTNLSEKLVEVTLFEYFSNRNGDDAHF